MVVRLANAIAMLPVVVVTRWYFFVLTHFFWPDNAQDALEMVGPFVASASRELVRVT